MSKHYKEIGIDVSGLEIIVEINYSISSHKEVEIDSIWYQPYTAKGSPRYRLDTMIPDLIEAVLEEEDEYLLDSAIQDIEDAKYSALEQQAKDERRGLDG